MTLACTLLIRGVIILLRPDFYLQVCRWYIIFNISVQTTPSTETVLLHHEYSTSGRFHRISGPCRLHTSGGERRESWIRSHNFIIALRCHDDSFRPDTIHLDPSGSVSKKMFTCFVMFLRSVFQTISIQTDASIGSTTSVL